MVWAKIDDEILDNEKIANAGVLGFAMHVAAITWCCRKLTDGFVPRARVRLLLDLSTLGAELVEATDQPEGIKDRACGTLYDLGDAQADRIAEKLVDCHLWLEDTERGGYWIHDFLEYNPSREEADAAREAKAASGKKGAAARWGSRGSKAAMVMAPAMADVMAPAMAPPMANGWQAGWQTDATIPVPTPIPIPTSTTIPDQEKGISAGDTKKTDLMAPAMADVMAPAMAPPMANGWQSDAPIPIPIPIPFREKGIGAGEARRFDLGTSSAVVALETFTTAVATATSKPFKMGRATFHGANLCDVLNGFAPKAGTNADAIAWLNVIVPQWVASVDAQYAGGWVPGKLLDWLNADKPDKRQSTGVRGKAFPVPAADAAANRSRSPLGPPPKSSFADDDTVAGVGR